MTEWFCYIDGSRHWSLIEFWRAGGFRAHLFFSCRHYWLCLCSLSSEYFTRLALPRLSCVKLKSLISMFLVFKKECKSTKFILEQLWPCKFKFAIDKTDEYKGIQKAGRCLFYLEERQPVSPAVVDTQTSKGVVRIIQLARPAYTGG